MQMGENNMIEPYNEPCKICGSMKQCLMIAEGRKSIYCEDCGNFEDIYVSPELRKEFDRQNREYEAQKMRPQSVQTINVPKCPICGSTDLSKITATQKAVKIAIFGIFGMGDNGKTWKCNSCGSKF